LQTTIGLISDTHGLLRPEALEILRVSDLIVHAGDVGDATIVERLGAIAPVTVVRGNIDLGAHAEAWPATAVLEIGAVRLYVLHDLGTIDVDPVRAGYSAVIFGHSHKPLMETKTGVLFVNPGSAGPRRFRLPISVGLLRVDGKAVSARLIDLNL
jgi:putative phosphoesterase